MACDCRGSGREEGKRGKGGFVAHRCDDMTWKRAGMAGDIVPEVVKVVLRFACMSGSSNNGWLNVTLMQVMGKSWNLSDQLD